MKNSFFIILLMTLALDSFAQVQQEWVRNYDNTSGRYEIMYDMHVSNDAVIVTGEIENTATMNDFCTVKYNNNGELLWAKYYNNPANNDDIAVKVLVDRNNNVIVGGRSFGGASSKMDFLIIKYSQDGSELWQRRFDGTLHDWDYLMDICLDANGNIYATGYTTVYNSGGNYLWDCLSIKLDQYGNQLWARNYNSFKSLNDVGTKIIIDRDEYVYVAGSSGLNLLILQYDLNGQIVWENTYIDSSATSIAINNISPDSNRNIVATGTCGYNGRLDDFFAVKYNSGGVMRWYRKISSGGDVADRSYSSVVDYSGNIYMTGTKGQNQYSDFMTAKLDSNGVTKWIRYYNSPYNLEDYASYITIDTHSNIYVSGSSKFRPFFYNVMTVLKYDSEGNEVWKFNFDSSSSNIGENGKKIVVKTNGDIFISGTSGTTYDYDFQLLKCSQLIGVNPIQSEIPIYFSLHQNYPNPFNPSTKIKFELPAAGNVSIRIFDIMGREVSMLVNEFMKPGVYEADFNAADLPSGVYLYKLEAGEFTETRKMILLK